jgi:mono/diheme cytochrome c family protein
MRQIAWLTVLFITIAGCLTTKTSTAPEAGKLDGPRLKVPDSIDLGEVAQDEQVEHLFDFSNIGSEPLQIHNVETSCGCTAVSLSSQVLAPGESGKMKVTVDTVGKKGNIVKTITFFSNDALTPEKTIQVNIYVKAPPHPEFDIGETLFSPRCRSCHADKGEGLIGASLYLAICYQCHGIEGEGGSATALSDPDYLKSVDEKHLYKSIAEGETGTAMPGYSQKKGGPLTEKQLNSLVEFILQWR